MLQAGERYKHYKGNLYEIVGVGRDSETTDEVVVYRALYDSADFGRNCLWVRPLQEFTGQVVVSGVEIPRFVKIV